MRKYRIAVLLLVLVLALSGCSKPEPEQLRVYSFSAEDELFSVQNGVIVISDSKDIFSGGDLKLYSDAFDDVYSFNTTFYILSGDEKDTLLSSQVTDMTGGSVSLEGDLGQVSGDGVINRTKVDDLEDLKNNLYLEVATINLKGEQNTYQLQMKVTEITTPIANEIAAPISNKEVQK